jgi:hypothetical protein
VVRLIQRSPVVRKRCAQVRGIKIRRPIRNVAIFPARMSLSTVLRQQRDALANSATVSGSPSGSTLYSCIGFNPRNEVMAHAPRVVRTPRPNAPHAAQHWVRQSVRRSNLRLPFRIGRPQEALTSWLLQCPTNLGVSILEICCASNGRRKTASFCVQRRTHAALKNALDTRECEEMALSRWPTFPSKKHRFAHALAAVWRAHFDSELPLPTLPAPSSDPTIALGGPLARFAVLPPGRKGERDKGLAKRRTP